LLRLRFLILVLTLLLSRQYGLSQGLSPATPAQEFIRMDNQVIAVENAQPIIGTFENATLSPWVNNGGNASVGTTSYAGSYGLTLGGTTTQSWISQDASGFNPGQMYQVSAWVKSSTATTNGVELWLHDTQGNGAIANVSYPGTSWQQISGAFTATATRRLRVHLVQIPGTAETTYWDSVSVSSLPPNGDFEMGALGPWAYAGGNTAVGTTSHSGFYGATLGGTTTQSWIYEDTAGLVPGQMYQVSAWVKASTATNNGVQLYLHDTQGNGSVTVAYFPGTAWQQISAAFTATSIGKLRIHLVQTSGTSETTYWDDVTVTPLPSNGDFEIGSLGPWLLAGGNASIGTIVHSGAYGATLGGTTAQSWIYADSAGLIPGRKYQVTAWVKATATTTNGVQLWLHDTQGNGSASVVLSPTTSWQQISTTFTATSTGKLRIHLIQAPNGTETTYWDDVAVVPVSSPTGAAAMASTTQAATTNYLLSPDTKLAAGSSTDPVKTITEIPAVPAGTPEAKGSSADPVLPPDQDIPPQP
jgi:Carbohydrate binding domain